MSYLNKELKTVNGRSFKILDELGTGGQGSVYKIKMDSGDEFAFKCYHSSRATKRQYSILERLVNDGSASKHFLWPIDLVKIDGDSSFGYIMPLLSKEYKTLNRYLSGNVHIPSYITMLRIAYNLVSAFKELHVSGKCYQDISYNNISFDPTDGSVLIFDNDNIVVNNTKLEESCTTGEFCAPELRRGIASASTATDLHSLSVLLFEVLYMDHPFKGALADQYFCYNYKAEAKILDNPVYIFDPTDTRNRPVDGMGKNAIFYHKIYSEKLRKLFEKSFTTGIGDPDRRTIESEWVECFLFMLDNIVFCDRCSEIVFIDKGAIQQQCSHCGNVLNLKSQLKFEWVENGKNRQIFLHENAVLYEYHINSSVDPDFSREILKVNRHPEKNLVGIKNCSGGKIDVITQDGNSQVLQSGMTFRLKQGIKFVVNNREIIIR